MLKPFGLGCSGGLGEGVSHLPVVFGRATRARSGVATGRVARFAALLVFALVITISLFGDSRAHAAGGGYGPGIAGPAGAPGGFSTIVTTHAFGTTGGSVTAAVPGGQAQLTVPDGAFGQPVQAVITAPDLTGINAVLPQLGFGGYSAIGGVGISIDDANGKPLTGLFIHPLTLTITGSGIGAGDLLVEFTSLSTAATLQAAVFTAWKCHGKSRRGPRLRRSRAIHYRRSGNGGREPIAVRYSADHRRRRAIYEEPWRLDRRQDLVRGLDGSRRCGRCDDARDARTTPGALCR